MERGEKKKGGLRRAVVLGGGTGTFTVLSGLKKHPLDITAIVSMTDDGGSTGRLRDEFGILPPGDIRQCLVALSEAPQALRDLFSYRFAEGGLRGHNFGNLFLTAAEKVTGDFAVSLAMLARVLQIRGTVVPVTLKKTRLVAELGNGKKLEGEEAIDSYHLISRFGIRSIRLSRKARANPRALAAIRDADIIIVGPGDFYTSLVPLFLVEGIGRALQEARGRRVLVANVMNKYGHTDNFTAEDFARRLAPYVGGDCFDSLVYNTEVPDGRLLRRYVDEGEPVMRGEPASDDRFELIGAPLLSREKRAAVPGDALARTFIRHDPDALARVLVNLVD